MINVTDELSDYLGIENSRKFHEKFELEEMITKCYNFGFEKALIIKRKVDLMVFL